MRGHSTRHSLVPSSSPSCRNGDSVTTLTVTVSLVSLSLSLFSFSIYQGLHNRGLIDNLYGACRLFDYPSLQLAHSLLPFFVSFSTCRFSVLFSSFFSLVFLRYSCWSFIGYYRLSCWILLFYNFWILCNYLYSW